MGKGQKAQDIANRLIDALEQHVPGLRAEAARAAKKIEEPDYERDRLLRVQDVATITRLSRTTLWRMERAGEFPKRVRITKNAIGWREREVLAWIAARKPKTGAG